LRGVVFAFFFLRTHIMFLFLVLFSFSCGLSFDESFGDVGRMMFKSEVFLSAFASLNNSDLLFVGATLSHEKWIAIRDGKLATLFSFPMVAPVAFCNERLFSVVTGRDGFLIHSMPEGPVFYHEDTSLDEVSACVFDSESSFAIVASANVSFWTKSSNGWVVHRTVMLGANVTLSSLVRGMDGRVVAAGWRDTALGRVAMTGAVDDLKVNSDMTMALNCAPLWGGEGWLVCLFVFLSFRVGC
jgi:hypothetical protein